MMQRVQGSKWMHGGSTWIRSWWTVRMKWQVGRDEKKAGEEFYETMKVASPVRNHLRLRSVHLSGTSLCISTRAMLGNLGSSSSEPQDACVIWYGRSSWLYKPGDFPRLEPYQHMFLPPSTHTTSPWCQLLKSPMFQTPGKQDNTTGDQEGAEAELWYQLCVPQPAPLHKAPPIKALDISTLHLPLPPFRAAGCNTPTSLPTPMHLLYHQGLFPWAHPGFARLPVAWPDYKHTLLYFSTYPPSCRTRPLQDQPRQQWLSFLLDGRTGTWCAPCVYVEASCQAATHAQASNLILKIR